MPYATASGLSLPYSTFLRDTTLRTTSYSVSNASATAERASAQLTWLYCTTFSVASMQSPTVHPGSLRFRLPTMSCRCSTGFAVRGNFSFPDAVSLHLTRPARLNGESNTAAYS